jgi:hypothetical protein
MLSQNLLEILGCTPSILPLPSLNLFANVYALTTSSELS